MANNVRNLHKTATINWSTLLWEVNNLFHHAILNVCMCGLTYIFIVAYGLKQLVAV